jgi:hypothetical protein
MDPRIAAIREALDNSPCTDKVGAAYHALDALEADLAPKPQQPTVDVATEAMIIFESINYAGAYDDIISRLTQALKQ